MAKKSVSQALWESGVGGSLAMSCPCLAQPVTFLQVSLTDYQKRVQDAAWQLWGMFLFLPEGTCNIIRLGPVTATRAGLCPILSLACGHKCCESLSHPCIGWNMAVRRQLQETRRAVVDTCTRPCDLN